MKESGVDIKLLKVSIVRGNQWQNKMYVGHLNNKAKSVQIINPLGLIETFSY